MKTAYLLILFGVSVFCDVNVSNETALLLSSYIREGKLEQARAVSEVDSNFFVGIKSYSGFFTVNEKYNSNMFFWYFPVLNKSVSESPWIIWLQEGPDSSSLTGVFDKIGPFIFVNDTLTHNPFTWLRNHSLLFISNPVGAGFSFTDQSDGYATNMASHTNHLYSTLEQFLQVFPELKTAPLYLAGESYAGKYVPALAMEIHQRNQGTVNLEVNFKGVIIGNGFVDPSMLWDPSWPFYYFGLLERRQVEAFKPMMDSYHDDIKANRSIEAKRKYGIIMSALLFLTNMQQTYNLLHDSLPETKYTNFLRSSEVKRALHVGDINFSKYNTTVFTKLDSDFLNSAKPMLEYLLEHYRVLVYCGQLDLCLPCVVASENYRTWKWSGTERFLNATRYAYEFKDKLSGYYKTGGNFTEVMIRRAGHMSTLDAPGPIQDLVTRWTHNKPLSKISLPYEYYVQWLIRRLVPDYIV